jgi:hypothetical protein
MTAEQQIRFARWLMEQAAPSVADLPQASAALDEARQILGQLGGDYRDGEVDAFARDEARVCR